VVEVAETEAEAEAEEAPAPGRWLIYADEGGTGQALADRLEERGDSCTLVHVSGTAPSNGAKRIEIDPASADDAKRVVELLGAGDGPAYKGIVHMWNLDAPTIAGADVESLDQHMVTGAMSTIFLTQALMDVDAATVPRLYMVTKGAESIGKEPQETAAVQATAWGLGRVVMNEVPKLRAKLIDLDPASDVLDGLVDELMLEDETEDAVGLRGAARYAHRYVRAGGRDADARRMVRSDDERYRLETTRAGTFEKLLLRSYRREELEPGQVEIRVAATGLNFADVMKALGLYPGLPDGPVPLGIECSGRISAVADDVTEFKPGDEVVAIAPFSFGSFVRARAMLVAPKPKRISFEEAATLPVAYLTTHYAMNYLGRMAPGEKVLVHSATGGVGLAAIQLARQAGAEVLATAGTPEKRDFLRSLGIEHVFDSRSLEFADEVLDVTDGRGVDIVLNSLAGEGIRKGMNVLAPYGRFLEIGKRDIYANSKIGMRPFRKNLAFMAIDLDAAMRERPELQAELFRELMQMIEKGELGPLPFRVFPASNVAGAFRYMAQAKHIGKVLVSFQEPEVPVAPAAVPEMTFREDATYLMTGGLGGFGLAVAQWMVEQGARNLVLMGRSGASSDQAKEAVESMRSAGANIVIAKADVTSPEQTAKVLADIDESMPPLRGVLHAAMVLRDRLLLDLNAERVRDIWAPKVYGAWNLHELTKDRDLDFFALFSSLASIFGTGGQGNYASANSFLDSFASHLRSLGRPALTVSWGYVGEVGWVARHGETGDRLEAQGVHPFSPAQALQLLGRFMQDGTTHVGVMNMDWRQWGETALNISPRFADLASESGDGGDRQQASGSATRKALLAAGAGERVTMMQDLLREQVARVLGAAPDKLDVERPLTDLGLDSLMAVELRNWVEGDLRLSLPTVELMRGHSVARLAEILVEQLAGAEAGTTASPVGEITKAAAAPEDGKESEVE
jgi:NADPH:quinone reductase-like Zn-dependent oxidoreductase/aryl carrier-like protein